MDILRAKHNPIVGPTGAGESAGGIVFGVTISVGAASLEEPRVVCGPALSGITTVLVGFEHRARVVTPACCPQLSRALPIYVRCAPEIQTNT